MSTSPASDPSKADAAKSQSALVIEGIENLIAEGALAPGDRLPIESDLADQLGVSRGSLREGIRALSAMGVLYTRQGSGTYVSTLDPEGLLGSLKFWVRLQAGDHSGHIFTVRRSLECESAALAARSITDEQLERAAEIILGGEENMHSDSPNHLDAMRRDLAFHKIIAEASGNPALAALADVFSATTERERMLRSLTEQRALPQTHAEHVAILRALEDRNPDRARMHMAHHLVSVEEFLRRHQGSQEPRHQ
jgi:DNA-binding FadR family transcriptional regulator